MENWILEKVLLNSMQWNNKRKIIHVPIQKKFEMSTSIIASIISKGVQNLWHHTQVQCFNNTDWCWKIGDKSTAKLVLILTLVIFQASSNLWNNYLRWIPLKVWAMSAKIKYQKSAQQQKFICLSEPVTKF